MYALLILIQMCFLCSVWLRPARTVFACSSLLLGVDVDRRRREANLRTRASLQLLEVLHRRRLIRKQVEARGRIFGELNAAIGEPVVEPMGGDTETPGELGDRQRPGHVARMRLM